jgi:hypothetical protein
VSERSALAKMPAHTGDVFRHMDNADQRRFGRSLYRGVNGMTPVHE